ncbi:MAG: pirin family protein, partial [Actinomycetia bacterium]|nr:pirin family protein [Actinomycetes bacterium]
DHSRQALAIFERVGDTGGMRVARHPHTGLATVSWLFTGRVDHIDSAGNWATVHPGDAVFMNAGRGITHSEHSSPDTTILHGAQLWYAFPDHNRFGKPSLDVHRPQAVHGDGWQARVFAGELLGITAPLKTRAPISGAELRLDPGTRLDIEVPEGHEHALLRVEGDVSLNDTAVPADHLAVVETGHRALRVEAGTEPVLALLIGGEPFGEEIIMWWNFIGRTHEEIETYRAAYQAEMGFEVPLAGSPLSEFEEPLGEPIDGELYDRLRDECYEDDRAFPQFGTFPAGQPAPIPAPALPGTRLRPRH